jgi:hypothetical protein
VSAQLETQQSGDEKLARNQALFREINERIMSLSTAFAAAHRLQLDLICECSDESCTNPIRVAVEDYQRVRVSAIRFLVYPRHDVPRLEQVVDRGNCYEIVEKFGDAARVVADDPLQATTEMASDNDYH